jgi:hypothetical protein
MKIYPKILILILISLTILLLLTVLFLYPRIDAKNSCIDACGKKFKGAACEGSPDGRVYCPLDSCINDCNDGKYYFDSESNCFKMTEGNYCIM